MTKNFDAALFYRLAMLQIPFIKWRKQFWFVYFPLVLVTLVLLLCCSLLHRYNYYKACATFSSLVCCGSFTLCHNLTIALEFLPCQFKYWVKAVFLRRFRDPIRVPRIENRVSRIRKSYHWALRIRENRVLGIREIGYTGSNRAPNIVLKKNLVKVLPYYSIVSRTKWYSKLNVSRPWL